MNTWWIRLLSLYEDIYIHIYGHTEIIYWFWIAGHHGGLGWPAGCGDWGCVWPSAPPPPLSPTWTVRWLYHALPPLARNTCNQPPISQTLGSSQPHIILRLRQPKCEFSLLKVCAAIEIQDQITNIRVLLKVCFSISLLAIYISNCVIISILYILQCNYANWKKKYTQVLQLM